jgi:regulator of protease activity HflC (stomatin/prohibitin superfamily)
MTGLVGRRAGALAPVIAACAACATIPPGSSGVLIAPGGVAPAPLAEGVHVIGPFASVERYDLRAQERTEDLTAISADGAALEARASLLTFHPLPGQLVALAREVGPDYYEMLVRPVVRSTVRRVLARLRADQLDTPTIIAAEREITRLTTERLASRHVAFDAISLRTLGVPTSSAPYRSVLETGVEEQRALAERQREQLARRRADEWRESARGVAAAHALLAPTLTPEVLADAANRAWARLLAAPATHVEVRSSEVPYLLEVRP